MLTGLLGRKVGMTQVFGQNGVAIPVTVIEAGPCVVTQVKTASNDGYEAVQLGFGTAKHPTRPMLGHLGHSLPQTERQRRKQQQEQAKSRQEARQRRAAEEARASAATDEDADEETETEATETETEATETETEVAEGTTQTSARSGQRANARRRRGSGKALGPFALLREVRFVGGDMPAVGDTFSADLFSVGEQVDVIGTSKGKGFGGVMKRHGFRGGPRTHGQSDRARRPGSIGPGTTPGRVYKGTRMAGRMGGDRVTVKALEVVQADPERNLLVVKGSVPGANGSVVMIRKGVAQLALAARSGANAPARA